LRFVFTVNDTIAEIYSKKYKVDVRVVRNVPVFHPLEKRKTRAELGLPEGFLVILQGAFMDKDRGVIEAVRAMKYLPQVHLLLVGAGEEWEAAGVLREQLKLASQITILPKQPFEKLRQLTASADVGLTLDKAVHNNYLFSLPNKLFDYIHAGIPVVASPLPEVQKVVLDHGIGAVIVDWDPEHIAQTIRTVLDQPKATFTTNLHQAASRFQWAHEAEVITRIVREAGVINEGSSKGI
jgi:glycosyltransferase involved in cell wall biosynthesis